MRSNERRDTVLRVQRQPPHRFYGDSFLRGRLRLPPVSFRIDREGGDYALFDVKVTVIFAILHVPSPMMHVFRWLSIIRLRRRNLMYTPYNDIL
jgi:hypothetical protein